MRATMERFFKSLPITNQGGGQPVKTDRPKRPSSTFRLTVLEDHEETRIKETMGSPISRHTDNEKEIDMALLPESSEPVDVVNNVDTTHATSRTVENHGPDPKPSNKEILSNPTLFQSHV